MKKDRYSSSEEILRSLLKEYRKKAGIKQEDLASILHVPQSFVSKYESGERLLTFIDVWRICAALGVPFDKFVKKFRNEANETQ